MADNTEKKSNAVTKAPKIGGFENDVQARDHFIGIAYANSSRNIANKQFGQYGVVADHAVRYGNAVMESRGREFRSTVSNIVRGVPVQPEPIAMAPATEAAKPDDVADLTKNLGELVEYEKTEGELPKNPVPGIAEHLNAALPPLAELK